MKINPEYFDRALQIVKENEIPPGEWERIPKCFVPAITKSSEKIQVSIFYSFSALQIYFTENPTDNSGIIQEAFYELLEEGDIKTVRYSTKRETYTHNLPPEKKLFPLETVIVWLSDLLGEEIAAKS